jgi:RecA DNA recombination protein
MLLARADLESLLRERKLDRTLTAALPAVPAAGTSDDSIAAATGITPLDARFGGGIPRGQISEIIGARSSGRTSLLLRMLAAATARGELAALVDLLDMLDVASAAAAGIDLRRLLWIRGRVVVNAGLCRDRNDRALDQAIKALTLVLQAGNFGLVVFDAADAPAGVLQRLPFTTWRRLQRIIEGSQTVCLLLGDTPIARSAGGLTIRTARAAAQGPGIRADGGLFKGLAVEVAVTRARAYQQETGTPLSTHAHFA